MQQVEINPPGYSSFADQFLHTLPAQLVTSVDYEAMGEYLIWISGVEDINHLCVAMHRTPNTRRFYHARQLMAHAITSRLEAEAIINRIQRNSRTS